MLPFIYFIYQKVPGRAFFPNLSTFITFAAAPLVLTPFVRNQAGQAGQRSQGRYGYGQFSQFQFAKSQFEDLESQTPLFTFTSKCPLKAQISQGLGRIGAELIFHLEPRTARRDAARRGAVRETMICIIIININNDNDDNDSNNTNDIILLTLLLLSLYVKGVYIYTYIHT